MRRKAEEKRKEAKEWTDDVMRDAREKERSARECFGRLGVLFLRAAKGEVDVDATKGLVENEFMGTEGRALLAAQVGKENLDVLL